jgi:urea transport system ATP-binding protein
MLQVDSIDLHCGAAQALRNVSLAAEAGKVTCVLGRNGVGKTSLLDALAGQHAISKGAITFDGQDITHLKPSERARKTLFWRETEEEASRVNRILEIIRLSPVRHRVAGSLAHGQKQWLEIGMLLGQGPKLLLVDEPVAGMTDAETRQTAELLKEINRDRTVVVVEHDMTFVRELGVKVTCLHEGSVLAEGTIDQVSENERVVEVYLGR